MNGVVLPAAVWMGGGWLLAWIVLSSQAATVSHMRPRTGHKLVWHLAAGFVFRLAAMGCALILALRQGLAPVVWLLVGFWLMRLFLIWRIHSGRIFQRQLRM